MEYQINIADKLLEYIWNRISEDMPDKISEIMSDGMPDRYTR